MRKKSALLSAIFVFMFITACSSDKEEKTTSETNEGAVNNADPTVIQLGHTLTENSSWQKGALFFKKQVEERTNGRYVVNIFPNAQLSSGNQQRAIEMLRQGVYDVDITSGLIWSGFDRSLNITALPWILPTLADVEEIVINGDGGELLKEILSENGVIPVAIGETGYRQMLNNERQIRSPEDLENMRIRIPGSPLFVSLFDTLGADATTMDFNEVFTALEQGTIDGMEGVTDVIVANNFYEVLDFISVNNYNFDVFFLTFSESFFNQLSGEDKEIFMSVGEQAADHATAYARNQNKESLDLLRNYLDVYEPTEEEIQEFQEAASPIYDAYRDTFSEDLKKAFNYPEVK